MGLRRGDVVDFRNITGGTTIFFSGLENMKGHAAPACEVWANDTTQRRRCSNGAGPGVGMSSTSGT